MSQHSKEGQHSNFTKPPKKKRIRQRKAAQEAINDDLLAPSITTRDSEFRSQRPLVKPIKSDTETLIVSEREEVTFKTGSKYKGGWNTLGMAGRGIYTMFHDVQYDGSLDDGKFHGKGTIWYPNNSRVEGVWHLGHNVERQYYFNDGLEFTEKDWAYCKWPDRRFKLEYKSGIRATGKTLLANRIPPRPIPPGCYDVGDGFYNPVTKCVTHPQTGRILRIPPLSQEIWIMQNCRKSDGLPLYPPTKKSSLLSFADDLSISSETTTEEKLIYELPFDIQEVGSDEPFMADKSTGRFDLLHKKVDQRAYNSKYILIDEIRNRACKKHRLYLPALKVKTKVTIIPDLRVIPPFRCVHDKKAVLANKTVLLLKMLKECDQAGGICFLNPGSLKRYKKDFKDLLYAEKEAVEMRTSDTDSSRPSPARVLSYLSTYSEADENQEAYGQRDKKIFAFKEGDQKRSIFKGPEHRALRAKELATMLKDRASVISEEFETDSLINVDKNDDLKNRKCYLCSNAAQEKMDALLHTKKIKEMVIESEKEEIKREKDIREAMIIEKYIEQLQNEEIGLEQATERDGEMLMHQPSTEESFLDDEKGTDVEQTRQLMVESIYETENKPFQELPSSNAGKKADSNDSVIKSTSDKEEVQKSINNLAEGNEAEKEETVDGEKLQLSADNLAEGNEAEKEETVDGERLQLAADNLTEGNEAEQKVMVDGEEVQHMVDNIKEGNDVEPNIMADGKEEQHTTENLTEANKAEQTVMVDGEKEKNTADYLADGNEAD